MKALVESLVESNPDRPKWVDKAIYALRHAVLAFEDDDGGVHVATWKVKTVGAGFYAGLMIDKRPIDDQSAKIPRKAEGELWDTFTDLMYDGPVQVDRSQSTYVFPGGVKDDWRITCDFTFIEVRPGASHG